MEVQLTDKSADRSSYPNPMETIMKRQANRKKPGKSEDAVANHIEVEKFKELFTKKQKEMETNMDEILSLDPNNRSELFEALKLNEKIRQMQKLYSNATLFLRIYDKKIFQEIIQGLQSKLQALENEVIPKKKFGFKVKRKSVTHGEGVNVDAPTDNSENAKPEMETVPEGNMIGISGKIDENIVLSRDVVHKRDVVLRDLRNCHVTLEGVPATVHATNLENCRLFMGPVATSVLIENMRRSKAHLACQQLRVHDTTDTDFHVHVTSTPVIENCKSVRFGMYKFRYDGIDDDYEVSRLSRDVNRWDRVDDFNWLVNTKPSPNWSKIEEPAMTD